MGERKKSAEEEVEVEGERWRRKWFRGSSRRERCTRGSGKETECKKKKKSDGSLPLPPQIPINTHRWRSKRRSRGRAGRAPRRGGATTGEGPWPVWILRRGVDWEVSKEVSRRAPRKRRRARKSGPGLEFRRFESRDGRFVSYRSRMRRFLDQGRRQKAQSDFFVL